jgi:hypothetical protein
MVTQNIWISGLSSRQQQGFSSMAWHSHSCNFMQLIKMKSNKQTQNSRAMHQAHGIDPKQNKQQQWLIIQLDQSTRNNNK